MKKILVVLFSYISSISLIQAQNCPKDLLTGQNLVINGDFSQGYTGWTYTADPSGTNGYIKFGSNSQTYSGPGYIFASSSADYFNHDGFDDYADHSSSTDNMMLMVDGICKSGITLWSENITVSPNTNYYFSVWISSLKDNPNFPGNLDFRVGPVGNPAAAVSLGTTVTAPATGHVWKFYEATWNSGSNSGPIAITIANTTTQGCDTEVDFAIDDISFIPGCSYGSTGPQPDLGPDRTLCGLGGSGILLNSNVPQNSTTTITWSDGTTGFGMNAPYTLNVTAPGTYSVCVSDNGSCTKSDIIVVTNTFSVDIGPSLELCDPAAVTLDAGFTGIGVTYKWYKNFPTEADGNNTQKTYYVNTPGTYKVEVTDPSCGMQTAEATITSKAPLATNAVYCNPGNITLSVSPDNSGQYKWWTSPTSTNPADMIQKGLSTYTFAATPTNDYTFYVQDTSSFRVTVGLPLTGNGLTNPQNRNVAQETELKFDVQTAITIDSIYIDLHTYNCPSQTIQLQVTDKSGNVIGTSPVFQGNASNGCVVANSIIFKMPVGITVPAGTGYFIKMYGGASQNMNWYQNAVTYPLSYAGGVVTFTGNSTSWAPNAIPGMYRWVVTAGNACARVPVTATYKSCTPPPNPPIPNAGSDFEVCNTNTTQLHATLGAGESGVWTFATGSSGSVNPATSPTATLSFAGNSATMVWNVTNAGGTSKDTVVITKVTVATPSIISSSSTICANTTGLTFTASPDNTANGSTYQWTVLSGDVVLVSGQTTYQLTADAGTSKSIITLTETNNNCSASINDTLKVIPLTPKASAGSDFNTCSTTFTLTGMPAQSAGTWKALTSDPDQLLTKSSPSSAIVSNLSMNSVYEYMYTIADACGTTRDTVLVTNNTVATPSIAAVSNTCGNTAGLTFTASPDNTAKGSTYQWTLLSGDMALVSGQTTYQLTADAGTSKSIITLTETNNNCSASINDTLSILDATPIAHAGKDFNTCNTSITLTGMPELSGGTWSTPTDPNQVFTPSSSVIASNLSLNTVYEFVYSISGTCGTTSDHVFVTVGAGGFAVASIIQPQDTVCVGSDRTLSVKLNTGTNSSAGPYVYSWLKKGTFNSVNTSDPTYSIVTSDATEVYYLYVKDLTTNCTADIDSVTIPSVPYQKLYVPNLITPNGDHSNDEFRIVEVANHDQKMLPKNSVLKIYNSWGNEVYNSNNYNNDWQAQKTSDGVYYYYLKAGCGGEEHKSWVQILGNVNK